MRSIFLFALLLPFHPSFSALAGDKINNGGGIWVCETAQLEITSSVLVDFYEAENEFKWTLIQPSNANPWKIVEGVLAGLPQKFPRQAQAWASVLADVRSRLVYIAGELSIADDSKYRAKPLPSLCRTGGGWQYRQFANWDDRSNRGIIREDYWKSPRISALDKAGLVWHEAIYRWLRVSYGDSDSTRARELVGLLFAENNEQFSLEQARARLAEILGRKNPVDPVDPAGAWICAIQNRQSNLWFSGYGPDQGAAKQKALQACGEGGDFMGFGCAGPGIELECGPIGTEEKYTCSVPYRRAQDQTFTANGRSLLEARVKALKVCGEAVGRDGAWLCISRDAVCK
jgi:hypothetical protein